MQLQPETLNVLRNFSNINTNLVIKEGKKFDTISPAEDIIASYTGSDEFTDDVAIFNMQEFLGVLGAFKTPELILDEDFMTIKEGKQKVNYIYADASLLIVPPAKAITFPAPTVSFVLTEDNISRLQKMSAILSMQDFAVIGDGKTIVLKIFNKQDDTASEFEIDMEVETSSVFQANFKIERLKLYQGSYTVDIAFTDKMKISRFTHDTISLMYYIAVESDSTFQK